MTEVRGEFLKEPEKQGSLVRISLGKAVSAGVEGPKHFVETSVINPRNLIKERKAGQFFSKTLKWGDLPIEGILEKYNWLKGKGLPVVPTLRYNKKDNTLLMTDMSRGGEIILVDRHHPLKMFGIGAEQIANWEALKVDVEKIAAVAYDNGNGMELDDDNYMIALDKTDADYQGDVHLVDIGYGANFLKDIAPRRRSGATLEENLKWARVFIREIQELV